MKTPRQSRRKETHSGIQAKRDLPARIAGHYRNQFVHQITVHLEEGPRADLVLVVPGSIANCLRARLRQRFRIDRRFIFYSLLQRPALQRPALQRPALQRPAPQRSAPQRSAPRSPPPRSEKCHPADFRQLALERLRPAQQISPLRLAPAECPGQQTLILRIREQLDFFNCRRAVQSAELKQPRHHPIDQRRADRTFADRKKFVRANPEVPQRESGVPRTAGFAGLGWKFRRSLHPQPRPVAVVPRRRSMQPNLSFQLDFRNPLQRLAQNYSLELQLPLVRNVLVMASAALPKVRTASFDAIGRRLDQLRHQPAREARLFLPDLSLNPLPRQHKRHKHRHAAPVRSGRRSRQPVTAVNQLFDGKKHGVLLVARAALKGHGFSHAVRTRHTSGFSRRGSPLHTIQSYQRDPRAKARILKFTLSARLKPRPFKAAGFMKETSDSGH